MWPNLRLYKKVTIMDRDNLTKLKLHSCGFPVLIEHIGWSLAVSANKSKSAFEFSHS